MGRVRTLALLFVVLTLVGAAVVFMSFFILGVPLPEERPENMALWPALSFFVMLVVPGLLPRRRNASIG